MARGYVYILLNPALPGQLKIGKTTGSPEERAKELSQHTGVPLPFVVAWQAELFYFDQAEREIHKRLKEFRPFLRREFFMMPLRDAISVAGEVADLYSQLEQAEQDAAEERKKKSAQHVPAPVAPPTGPPPIVPPVPPAVLIAGPRLLVLRGLKPNVEYVIEPGRNYIGRAAGRLADVDLESQEPPGRALCSQQHACITFEAGRLTIGDLNGSNGTFVNRRRIPTGQTWALAVGDIIQLGTVHMKLVVAQSLRM